MCYCCKQNKDEPEQESPKSQKLEKRGDGSQRIKMNLIM